MRFQALNASEKTFSVTNWRLLESPKDQKLNVKKDLHQWCNKLRFANAEANSTAKNNDTRFVLNSFKP